jgi:hypothetical protein
MTLVIAGYDYLKSINFSFSQIAEDTSDCISAMYIDGLFFVADSAITTNGGSKTLLNGFSKVYSIEANFSDAGRTKAKNNIFRSNTTLN